MKFEIKNRNFNSKSLIILVSIACYWFYLNFCFGYFLSKNFYNFFDTINKTDLSKIIEFRKKFSFKNTIKTISEFFWKLIRNWVKRIGQTFLLLIDAIDQVIKALRISRNKFKSIFKFKYKFRLLKNLLTIFWETFLIYCSLVKEILFLPNLFYWLIEWRNFIRLLMKESVFITRIVYVLYLILLGIFGILVGFSLGVYRRENEVNEIYIFLLLFLLQILYHNGFEDVLLEILRRRSLEPRNIEQFYNFSLKSIEQINPRPLKIALKEPDQALQIPLTIFDDPSVKIDIDSIWDESTNYEFELFKFYRNVDQKVKY